MMAMLNLLRRFARSRRGNVAVVTAISLPVVIGALGIGAEGASWMATKRAMQGAADAAAIAAATNAGGNFDVEARAVAARYGYQNGVNGVQVSATKGVPCPAAAGAGPCYAVSVSATRPILLAQVVGYGGDTVVGGAPAKIIKATAIAVQGDSTRAYCLLALGTSGSAPALHTNGAPFANFSGCNVMSNNGATCNGHNLQADVGDAHGVNSGCGVVQHSNVRPATDPYAELADDIPPNPCSSYPQAPTKKNSPALPASNLVAGAVGWSGVQAVCGDLQLTGDATIGANTTLVIYNGDLDLNGHTLQTAQGVGATIIFAGTNGGGYTHVPTGGGVLDIAAPTSGPWSGVALYQDPGLSSGTDISAAGNSPTWDITGVAYFPHAGVTFSGAVSKASHGSSCFAMVANTILINGTGSIFAHGECDKAGVTLPTSQVPSRGALVG
jgi:hypothetical protein